MSEIASSNVYIQESLNNSLAELEEELEADTATFIAPIREPFDSILRDVIESKKDKRKNASIILETNGGYIEVAERISNILRNHYPVVDFVIPDHAFSAGTVLALSGNDIWMDYFSVLGPIDPQISIAGRMVPALGYVEKFNQLMRKADEGQLNTAEMAYLIEKFDPAEIYHFEEAKQLSVDLLKDWLVKYKFKSWKTTESTKRKVTIEMKRHRAEEIAKRSGDPSYWHSHSRGINKEVLQKDVGLLIQDFRTVPDLFLRLDRYYRFLKDYLMRRGHETVIHMGNEFISQ